MYSDRSGTPQRVLGFPIRISTDRSLVGSSPWLFAATHVLHRLQAPRHPPLALCSLENKDARARYGILKRLASTTPVEPRAGLNGAARLMGRTEGAGAPSKRNRRGPAPSPTLAGGRNLRRGTGAQEPNNKRID